LIRSIDIKFKEKVGLGNFESILNGIILFNHQFTS